MEGVAAREQLGGVMNAAPKTGRRTVSMSVGMGLVFPRQRNEFLCASPRLLCFEKEEEEAVGAVELSDLL
jgi:hypothetical protein